MDFTWDPSGSIDVVAHFQAIPDVTLSLSSDSIDQTVMAAFVLLVLLTAAQAGLVACTVWGRMERASSVRKILLVCHDKEQNVVAACDSMCTSPATHYCPTAITVFLTLASVENFLDIGKFSSFV